MSRQPLHRTKQKKRKANTLNKKKADEKPQGTIEQSAKLKKAAAVIEPVATQSPDQPRVTIRYFDQPECAETFSDSINGVSFDGQSLRIELGVTRLDERRSDGPPTGRRYPACRLVLTRAAAVDLINKMQQVRAALARASIVKTTANSADPKKA